MAIPEEKEYEAGAPMRSGAPYPEAERPVREERPRRAPERKAAATVAGGSLVQGLTGGGAAVLAILGLAGILPAFLATIATIAVGAAFFIEGMAIVGAFNRLRTEESGRLASALLGAGVTAEFIGGIAGVVLGVLALLGTLPALLVPIAVIVFGGSLLLSSGGISRIGMMGTEYESSRWQETMREGVVATSGAQSLVGLGAVTLGILALLGYASLVLSLVGLLAVGASIMLSGTVLGGRMMSFFRR